MCYRFSKGLTRLFKNLLLIGERKMVDYTADDLQTANNYSDLNNTTIELFMDGMISYINAETSANLAHFRDDTVNAAGSKVVSITEAQEAAFLAGAALMLRAYNDRGPNVAVQGTSVTAIISDPHYRVFNMMLRQSINRLRGRSFVRT